MNYQNLDYEIQPSSLVRENLEEFNKLNESTRNLILMFYNESDINIVKKKLMKDINNANESNCTLEKYRNLWTIKRFFDKYYKLPFHIRARIDEYNKLSEHAKKLIIEKYNESNIEETINKITNDYKTEKYNNQYNYSEAIVKSLEELIKFFS
jgi:hypothetical protein